MVYIRTNHKCDSNKCNLCKSDASSPSRLWKHYSSRFQVLLVVLGHCVDGGTKGRRRAHFFLHLRGWREGVLLQCAETVVTPTYCVECLSACSSSQYLQPPPPPALVDKTPTPPTTNPNSAPRLHGYAGLLSKIKPLNPLFAVRCCSRERREHHSALSAHCSVVK